MVNLNVAAFRHGQLKKFGPVVIGCVLSTVENFLHRSLTSIKLLKCTICPGSSDPFYVVTYYIKWVTISWTHSIKGRYYRGRNT